MNTEAPAAVSAGRPNTPERVLDLVKRSRDTHVVCHPYLTTTEAARYLRRSTSWLLRCGSIPYVPGRPNLYAISDLDAWFEGHKHIPRT